MFGVEGLLLNEKRHWNKWQDMPYRELKIDPKTPPNVKRLIRRLEDHYLKDVHCLLRLPVPNYRLTAGCNFSIAQVLLAAVGGLSVTLYKHTGGSGKRFKNLLIDHYPWTEEPASTVSPLDAADIIYSVFRNPVTHDLGLDTEKKAKTPKVKIKRLVTKHKTRGLPEKDIEKLEITSSRYHMSATITVRADATVLLVEALYWGIRSMVENLTSDKNTMLQAENYLASI